MGVGGQLHAPAALPPGKRPGTYCMGGWVGPRAGLDSCGKSRPHRDSIPGPSSQPKHVGDGTVLLYIYFVCEKFWFYNNKHIILHGTYIKTADCILYI
jgi:hypothetical protein